MTTVTTENPVNRLANNHESRAELSPDASPLTLRSAFGQFPSGIAALAGYANGVREGIAVSSFTVGVSLDPALVSFAVQKTSRTWPRLRQSERIGISILGQGQDQVCRQLASKDRDRFAGLDLDVSERGGVFVRGASLWLDTSVYAEYPAGDHQLVLLEVHGLTETATGQEPLVFHRSHFRTLSPIRGNE